uniref:Copper type II ascorbate-dependent monooxygenase C-terminal domain-containing protein n=1 Tax=Biomphalaria glabrata TaxID=6526 RepID=A0A2C9M226_BIOGL
MNLKRDKSTLFGEATNEEMCFGFLTYYPLENLSEDSCLGSGPDVMYCDPNTYRGCADLFNNYTNFNTTKLYTDLTQNCIPVGPCLEECKEAILLHKKENPCLRDEIFEFIKQQMWRYDPVGSLLINLFASCEIEVYKSLNQIKSPQAKGRNSAPKFINEPDILIDGQKLASDILIDGQKLASNILIDGQKLASNILIDGQKLASDILIDGQILASDILIDGKKLASDILIDGQKLASDILIDGQKLASDILIDGQKLAYIQKFVCLGITISETTNLDAFGRLQ